MYMDGFKFTKHIQNNDKIRWRCNYYYRGCLAIIHTIEGQIVKLKNVHNHPPIIPTTQSNDSIVTQADPNEECIWDSVLPN